MLCRSVRHSSSIGVIHARQAIQAGKVLTALVILDAIGPLLGGPFDKSIAITFEVVKRY
jgi:hypothetical protein